MRVSTRDLCRRLLSCALLWALASAADATPLVVGGFTFDAGEVAFADDAYLVSGTVGHTCNARSTPASSVAEALSGSDVLRCVNNTLSTPGVVEVRFLDNSIENGSGADLIIFELSGPLPPGTADPRERFGVSVLYAGGFSAFSFFDPVATGINTGADPTLDIFAAQIDLSAFAVPIGESVDSIRLDIRNNNLGTRSADIAALGAIHSAQPIPEPAPLIEVILGLVAISLIRRMLRSTGHRQQALTN